MATTDETGVFLRRTSGVVRAMSSLDGMYYGYLSATGIYGLAFYFFVGAGAFPHANFFLANLISLVFFLPIFAVYAMLGSAMPRSGGDYVFTSRLLTPGLGYTVAQAFWVFWQYWFCFLAASTIVSGLIAPLFDLIGQKTASHAWIHAGEVVTRTSVKLPITIALILIAGWIMSRGLRPYLLIQKYFMMPAAIIGLLLIAGVLLFVPSHTFLSNLGKFQRTVGGLQPSGVVAKARSLGFNPGSGTNWADTLGMAVNFSALYVWCIWTSELMGELKSARKMRSVFQMFAGAGVLMFVTWTVGLVLAYRYMGSTFIRSFSWLVINHPDALGGTWDFRGPATLFYIPTLNLLFGVVLFLCFLGPVSQSLFNTIISSSRLLLAMSFDRLLPEWVGRVNKKGAPEVAVWGGIGLSVVVALVLTAKPDLTEVLFWSGFVTLLAMLATVVAGTVFPWRMREVYDASPTGQLRLFGQPAITVYGVIGTLFLVAICLTNLIHPSFGLFSSGAARVGLVTAVVLVVFFAAAYEVARRYRRSSGIDVSLAFRAVPPE